MRSRPWILALLLLNACAPKVERGFKVGLVTDVGGLNDQGFNSLAYKGLLRAKKALHIRTNVIESHEATDYEKNIQEFAEHGYNLIISVGFMMGDATKEVAERFPKSKFAIVDYKYAHTIPNIDGIT
ncbi:MAG: BMP family ABC transporter substrate-binding protein, partial [Cyanobacteria bacterium REEB65]|nr:BMP family ABC transporter substrate-binding protein [Cyanobacteria bacterium REEB65]